MNIYTLTINGTPESAFSSYSNAYLSMLMRYQGDTLARMEHTELSDLFKWRINSAPEADMVDECVIDCMELDARWSLPVQFDKD